MVNGSGSGSSEKRPLRAPRELDPALQMFLAQIVPSLGDSRRNKALHAYLNGTLTDHPNKNCDTLAQILPDTNEQRLQNLLTKMDWDEQAVNVRRVEVMRALGSEGDGVLVFDGTDFPKQGTHSVGVNRQYSGSLGKKANCQVTLNCHYTERTIAWPVNTQLYMPQVWMDNPERCAKAAVPADIGFQTKANIALALLDQANKLNIKHSAIAADADFGDDPGFLDELERQHERYVVDVRKDFTVSLSRNPDDRCRIEHAVAKLPKRDWRVIRWRQGYDGQWLKGSFIAVRAWRIDGQGKRTIGWLMGQRKMPNGSGQVKYFWSDFGAHTPLERMVEVAHRRASVERFHQDSKTLLGWDQYQGRLWQGFHRNSVLVMLAYSYLIWLERWPSESDPPKVTLRK